MKKYLLPREGKFYKANMHCHTVISDGKARQEQVAYQVTLTDGSVIYLNVVYLSNTAGAGFVSFQLVLGVV